MACNEAISNEYYDIIIENYELEKDYLPDTCTQKITESLYTIYISRENSPELDILEYSYNAIPKCFSPIDKSALESSGIIRAYEQPVLRLTGEGVLMGIIDSGIDYTNPLFINSENKTRIIRIWDQTINDDDSPKNFVYGKEYTSTDINLALASPNPYEIVKSTDEIGHGTFVAGIATGNKNPEKNFQGIATDSQIAVVKLKPAKQYLRDFFLINDAATCYQENDIIAAVKYLIDLSVELNMPLVITIALGSSQGSHSGRSALGNYINYVGRFNNTAIITGTGNEANTRHHFLGNLSASDDYIDVEIQVEEDNKGFVTELWGLPPGIFTISIISPSGETIPRIPAGINQREDARFIFENTVITINYSIAETGSGQELIFMRFADVSRGVWRIRVYKSGYGSDTFNMWLPLEEFLSSETFFLKSNPDTTLTEPSGTYGIISVGGYDHRTNSISVLSGRGYNTTNLVKPDFVAPSVDITGPGLRDYTTYTGSSCAVAITAGAVALFMEWCIVRDNIPVVDSVKIKNYFILGASRNPDTLYPNTEWGYGALNLYGVFENLKLR